MCVCVDVAEGEGDAGCSRHGRWSLGTPVTPTVRARLGAMQAPTIAELKSRLAGIEAQISSLKGGSPWAGPCGENSAGAGNRPTEELKGVLVRLRQEHASILQSIDRALQLVNDGHGAGSVLGSNTGNSGNAGNTGNSPSSPRLLDRINAAIHSAPAPPTPTRPALEKSRITFNILDGLGSARDEWSVASEEYLRKYGLM